MVFDLFSPDGSRPNTVILLSHPLRGTAEDIEPIHGESDTFRFRPAFDKPGTVRLTLQAGSQLLGTREITVVPLPLEADFAVERLYPKVVRGEGVLPGQGGWMSMVSSDLFGANGSLTPEELAQVRAELPLILKHPDWSEIIEMRVAKLEADLERDAVRQLVDEADPGQWGAIVERPLPEFLARALEKKVVSPYAQALQDKARESVRARKYLVPPYRTPGRIQD